MTEVPTIIPLSLQHTHTTNIRNQTWRQNLYALGIDCQMHTSEEIVKTNSTRRREALHWLTSHHTLTVSLQDYTG